jgi:para-nitrobenzyl esterase
LSERESSRGRSGENAHEAADEEASANDQAAAQHLLMARHRCPIIRGVRPTAFSMRSLICGALLLAACSREEAVGELTLADSTCVPGEGVCTRFGSVQGTAADGVTRFLGIPYAAPPIGGLRWKAPQDPVPWTTTLQATTAEPRCPQLPTHWATGSDAEDCLHLNVWTPRLPPGALLPVMVYIHGGGFTTGDPLDPNLDPTPLARDGQVVVVTFNYRLGPLGFLAHPALIAEDTTLHSSGNYGLLDQQQALRWVHDNIAAFGGDPGRVTIFGESAGGISVCLHGAMPSSYGLYHRAIVESGECLFVQTHLSDAETLGQQFAARAGCTSEDVLACLRALPMHDPAHGTQGVLDALWPDDSLDVPGPRWAPNVDGSLVPLSPWLWYYLGYQYAVPTLVGTNRDESTVFTQPVDGDPVRYPAPLPQTEAAYSEYLRRYHAADADFIQTYYDDPSNPGEMWNTLLDDGYFNCAARWHAHAMTARTPQVFEYSFTHLPIQPLGTNGWGVFHSSELFYVFHSWWLQPGVDSNVSAAMIAYWSRFAATGDPNGGGQPTWPVYTATGEAYLDIGDTLTTGDHLTKLRRPPVDGCADVLNLTFHGQ